MKITDRIKELNLPFGHYVVVGGVMEVHGIRPARDIDIVADKYLFAELKKQGWKRKFLFRRVLIAQMITNGKGVEAMNSYKYGKFRPTVEELIQKAEVIDGVPFLPLKDLMTLKHEFGGAKHRRDVELIKAHLEKKEITH